MVGVSPTSRYGPVRRSGGGRGRDPRKLLGWESSRSLSRWFGDQGVEKVIAQWEPRWSGASWNRGAEHESGAKCCWRKDDTVGEHEPRYLMIMRRELVPCRR